MHVCLGTDFLPAGCVQSVQPAGPKIALRFPCLLVGLLVHPHLSRAQ